MATVRTVVPPFCPGLGADRVSSASLLAGDPWREATKSADGMNFASTSWEPIAISDGFHCSDLLTRNAQVDATVAAVQTQALASMKEWLAGWEPSSRK